METPCSSQLLVPPQADGALGSSAKDRIFSTRPQSVLVILTRVRMAMGTSFTGGLRTACR